MYTLKLKNGKEITGLKWDAGRFWCDEDYRRKLTEEQLSRVTVTTDEEIITDYNDENFTGNFFMPGEYKDMAVYDYRKRDGEHGSWSFYIDKKMPETESE